MNLEIDPDLTVGLRGLLEVEELGFVALVTAAGLDPTHDFREADLSGADLRGQDLRAFDFTNARFDGALIADAKFNETVVEAQLVSADRRPGSSVTVTCRTLFLGDMAVDAAQEISRILGPSFAIAENVQAAAQALHVSRDRHPENLLQVLSSTGEPPTRLPTGVIGPDFQACKQFLIFTHIVDAYDAAALLHILDLAEEHRSLQVCACVTMSRTTDKTVAGIVAKVLERHGQNILLARATDRAAPPINLEAMAEMFQSARDSHLVSAPGGKPPALISDGLKPSTPMPAFLLVTGETSREAIRKNVAERAPDDREVSPRDLRCLILQSGKGSGTALKDFVGWYGNALSETRSYGSSLGPRRVQILVAEATSTLWRIFPREVTARLVPYTPSLDFSNPANSGLLGVL